MVFKVDFRKAFDSLRWDFLDLILEKFGFGLKWRSWIKGFLQNGRSSILVNGSPTDEFELFRGLRQGDPMSPFLFILAMEGLHALMCKAKPLVYLKEFLSATTTCESPILCVTDAEVSHMAHIIGCGAAKFPFKYLGIPVGCNMTRCAHWHDIVHKFSVKLSSWKAHLLSVGGRLSFIKSVLGNLPTNYMSIYLMPVSIRNKLESMRRNFFIGGDLEEKRMSWVKWKKCLASKQEGGLGIGSILGLNNGLLYKWIWRFLNKPSDLWARVIQCIYGLDGGIHTALSNSQKCTTWGFIVHLITSLKQKGMDLISLCSRKIGNGADTRFWADTWCGKQPLKELFPRIYLLDSNKNCTVAGRVCSMDRSTFLRRNPRGGVEAFQFTNLKSTIECISLTDQRDSWHWVLDSPMGFSVASVRLLIDSRTLDTNNVATRWNRSIPIKVNVFLWRLKLNKLPSRVNQDRRGIEVDSILCPFCLEDIETVNHSFFNCGLAKDLWALLAKWWDLDILICGCIAEWYDWLDALRVSSKVRLLLEGVGGTLMWTIWYYRNQLIFSSSPPKKATLWDFIVSQSFLWISSRNPKCNLNWVGWLKNPLISIVSM
ncbi:RNA-directed DNA polymerase, eukaryota, reverse transcriptase zinc-binding domain protein [Tanacetum coccineum]